MLKLNKKRTFLIGFAFFGILLLWQVYDSWCPTLLTEIIKTKLGTADELEVQWLVGIIMACDNLAALILLPILENYIPGPRNSMNQHIDLSDMLTLKDTPRIPRAKRKKDY